MRQIVFLLALLASAADAAVICGQRFQVGGSWVPYCTNGRSGPTVIVIHGTNRNADDYADYLDDLSVQVIAPEFQARGPGLYWDGGWREGDRSQDATRTSSFAVVDMMVAAFGATHVIGHSAGGQFVNRYSAGTSRGDLRFIVMNPSSYLYLDRTRPSGSDDACPEFNDYKYGLDRPNRYMSRGVAPDFPDRDVLYLLGNRDTVRDSNLDVSCEAMRQGKNRYVRGLRYYEHLARVYGRQVHRQVVVSGIGHSASRMMKAARPHLPK